MAAVSGDPEEVARRTTDEYLAELASRPALERELPTDEADLTEFSRSSHLVQAFGTSDWTPWHVLILLDDDLRKPLDWVGVGLEGHGFLGPVGIDSRVPFVELDGYGPRAAVARLMEWGHGVPYEVVPATARSATVESGQDLVRASISADRFTDERPAAERNGSKTGVFLVVDLRGDTPKHEFVTANELLRRINALVLLHDVGVDGQESEVEPGE